MAQRHDIDCTRFFIGWLEQVSTKEASISVRNSALEEEARKGSAALRAFLEQNVAWPLANMMLDEFTKELAERELQEEEKRAENVRVFGVPEVSMETMQRIVQRIVEGLDSERKA